MGKECHCDMLLMVMYGTYYQGESLASESNRGELLDSSSPRFFNTSGSSIHTLEVYAVLF